MTFDPERYLPYVADLDLAESDKLALIGVVFDAAGKIVADEFERARPRPSCGKAPFSDAALPGKGVECPNISLKETYNDVAVESGEERIMHGI